jgi:hypothetical protein
VILDGLRKRLRLDPRIVFRDLVQLKVLRRVAGIEVALDRALCFLRQKLHEQGARAPGRLFAAGVKFLTHGKPQASRDLLRL